MSHVLPPRFLSARTVSCVFVAALAAGTCAFLRRSTDDSTAPAAPAAPERPSGADALRLAFRAETPPIFAGLLPTPATPAAPATARPWAEVRDQIAEMVFGSDFDREAIVRNQAEFDAEGRFRPDYASASWNPSGARIGPRERAALDAIADSFAPLVRERAEAVANELTVALADAWARDDFVRRPVGQVPGAQVLAASQRNAARRGFAYADSFTHAGWLISIAVHGADRPALLDRVQELHQIRFERSAELLAYVAAL